MADPNIVTTDPTALYVSAGNALAFLTVIGYHVRNLIRSKNGNNPHSQSVKLLFKKLDEYKEDNDLRVHTIDKDVAVIMADVKRIDKKLDNLKV